MRGNGILILEDAQPSFGQPLPIDSDDVGGAGDSLPYPFDDNSLDPFGSDNHAFDLHTPGGSGGSGGSSSGGTDSGDKSGDSPAGGEGNVTYDPETGEYTIDNGDDSYIPTVTMSFDDYLEMEGNKSLGDYWQERSEGLAIIGGQGAIPTLYSGSELFDRIFGGSTVDIRPSGNIDLTFGASFQNIQNPILTEQQRRQGGFDFDMNINMSVLGKIGEKMKLTFNYNTEATFDFENQVKLEYTGFEDDIIQTIEAGNVSLPLTSTLIPGTQSLFGIKTKLQFGRLSWTSIVSQQRSETQNIQIQGGAQTRDFEVFADEYDANRHFFLGHYFRDNYETWLSTLPHINSPVNITKVEVWVTNTNGATINTRDVVAFTDLGEGDSTYWRSSRGGTINILNEEGAPSNYSNDLYQKLSRNSSTRDLNQVISTLTNPAGEFKMQAVRDFEKTRGRKLQPNEYTLNPQLGFISVNSSLQPDDILAISFQYTVNGETFQVGEFTDELPPNVDTSNVIFLKLLKSTSARSDLPIWDLMMKNIYPIPGAFQLSKQDFQLNVLYQDPGGGFKRYIPADNANINGQPLIRLFNLDRLNNNNDPQPDGIFDFVSGVTILPQNGRVIFPVLEPFGDHLRRAFTDDAGNLDPEANAYVYDELYDETKIIAQQFPQFNRFVLQGRFKSSVSSEIYLGTFNLPRGSVSVTAGGQALTENVDYTVDYNLGRIKIINESILNSGIPINVNFENNNLFGFQVKTLLGSRFDYWINDNFTLGATLLRLSERPFTQKVNIGDDPIKNRMIGFDINYSTDAPWLTRMVDKIPLIDTKEPSSITFTGEVAQFKPGHSRAIDANDNGVIFIDDFEGSRSAYDLKFPFISWELASTPSGARDGGDALLFPEADLFNELEYGKNRAKLNWYTIYPLFTRNNSATPDHLTPDDLSNHFVREIDEREIFPQAEFASNVITNLATFDLSYYPAERGPYNFDVQPTTYSAGLNTDGTLAEPESRWAGIMRSLETNDFEAANIEFVEFWVMDPYTENGDNPVPVDGGELYINLGNISEDILKDSRMFFENGLPRDGGETGLDSTIWGSIPRTQPITNAFDNDPENRSNQDRGIDGLDDDGERDQWQTLYLDELDAAGIDPTVVNQINLDPANDNYHYYRGDDYDAAQLGIIDRYKLYNNPEGNSPTSESTEFDFPSSATNLPNSEDLNRDYTLNETEAYFSYRIPIEPGMTENSPYVSSVVEANITFPNGQTAPVRWLQFKVPVNEFDQKVGNIADFRSIRFIRMFMTGFQEPITMRFARLELVRNQWRRYQFSLLNPGEYIPDDADGETEFNVSSVSIEENSDRLPINYVLPPNAIRESTVAGPGTSSFLQNEQALSMTVCELGDGDARGIFKALNIDLRRYKRIKMDIHAEPLIGADALQEPNDGDLNVFIRLGSDFTENYYELEIPLKITDPLDPALAAGDDNEDKKEAIWANLIDFPLDSFVQVKTNRNNAGISPFVPYVETGGSIEDFYNLTVIGNPDLGYVESVMIGIRNPKEAEGTGPGYCAEIWVNELRLSQIDERGGWAALARMDMKLADFGTFTASGNMHTIGFGTLEQQIDQRFKDNFYQYDLSTTLQLGNFFPKKWGVRLPMFAGLTRSYSTPEFDPYALDINLKTITENIRANFGADSAREYRQSVQDFNSIKSLNFTSVRIERDRKGKKPMPWNIENFDFTYAYNETLLRNPVTEYDLIKRHKGAVAYNFTSKALYISPFTKLIPRKLKYLQLIRDINFNPLPNSYGFRTEVNRQFGENLQRDLFGDGLIDPTYDKFFNWDRFYNLKWDITKSIKFDYSASNNARIDEPFGAIDTDAKRDSLWNNFYDGGRNIGYRHNMSLNYALPFKKVPILNWITVKAGYNSSYNWAAGSLGIADTLGNLINNNQGRNINGEFNFKSLYNKSKFLKQFNQSSKGGGGRDQGGFGKAFGDGDDDWGDFGAEEEEEEGKKKKDDGSVSPVVDFFFRLLLSVKRISVNYTQDFSTTVPGYMNTPKYIGITPGLQSPGFGFIAGLQPDKKWLEDAADNGWISTATSLNAQFLQTYSENLDIKATVEPIRDLRIDLNLNRTFTENHSEFFRNTNTLEDPVFESLNGLDAGSFNISYLAWPTLFGDKSDSMGVSELFNQFEDNREIISDRYQGLNPFSEGIFVNPFDSAGSVANPLYAAGYGPYSQDVLIPAFLATYTGQDPNTAELNVFKTRPRPNWRVTYNGLTKIKALEEIFTSFTLTHGYSSNLSVNNFRSDLDFDGNYFLYGHTVDTLSGNFVSLWDIPNIVISEQLSPLIGLDMTLVNDVTARVDYKKSRTLTMSFIDYQLSENKSTEFTIGLGYKITGFQLPFIRYQGRQVRLENDLTFKFDMSWRDDIIINYRLDQDLAEPTGGVRRISINPTIDYVLNDRLNIQFFFDRTRTEPKISTSFPVTTTNAGLKIRFTFTE